MVSEIIDNEWKVNPQLAWDRNYTTNALEVKNAEGEIVLQVSLRGDRATIQAVFFDDNGEGVALSAVPSGGALFQKLNSRDGFTLQYPIKPLFAYPSELHLGELLR